MRARVGPWPICLFALMLCFSFGSVDAPFAQVVVQDFAGLVPAGGNASWALTKDGYLFRCVESVTHVRELWAHIPTSASHPAQSPFVALACYVDTGNCDFWLKGALTATGEYFERQGNDQWVYVGSIPGIAGHPITAPFVGLAFPDVAIAITADGDYFLAPGHVPYAAWAYLGNVVEQAGVVPAKAQSLGAVKGSYR